MTILQYFSKYYTKFICLCIFLVTVIFSVLNYNKSYDNTLAKIKNIEEIDNAFVKITSFPDYDGEKVFFEGKIIGGAQKELLNSSHRVYFETEENINLYPGDTVVLTGDKYPLTHATNIGGFDQISYCKSENNFGNIYATELKVVSKNKSSFVSFMHNLRQSFAKKAQSSFEPRYSGVVKALVTGDKTAIYESDSTSLKKSGVYHIVAISGLHLNIFIMFFSKLIASLKIKRLRKALLALGVCGSVGLFVLLFTGFGFSVIRAFAMLVISLGSAVFARKYSGKNALLLSTIIIIILIPSSYFNVGFRLSVLSTYAVLLSADIIKHINKKEIIKNKIALTVVSVLITSIVCTFVTLPVTANSFGYVPLYSWIANLFIIPLMGPALGICVIFGLASVLGFGALATILTYPVKILIFAILKIASIVASLPFSVVNTYPLYTLITLLAIATAGIVIYLIFKNKKRLAVFTAIILCVANMGIFLYNNNRSDAKVVFADVGQGDCTIIALPGGGSVMIDFGTNSDIYYLANDVKSTLIKLNIPKISAAVVSHFHKDHISGIIELTHSGLIEKVFVPEFYDTTNEESVFNRRQLLAACQKTGTPMLKIDKGDYITVGDAHLKILSPEKDMDFDANDMSSVVKMTYGKVTFLFTGDVSKRGIYELVKNSIDCDVLKVAHHGSKNSADVALINKTSPEYAVISCSEGNYYGHPHKETLELLERNNAKIYRTDKMGAIIFNINKDRVKSVETMR